ncbi:MAG: orc1/cdc6 family replication initiation protein [archaeon]|nr:orc1/cdc6 family replication initiation protein [archaeon]
MSHENVDNDSIFVRFIQKRRKLVRDRSVLQTTYIPEELPHRKEQIDKIVGIIAVALNGEKPSNIMIYGKTGTGKTAVLNYIGKELRKADPTNQKCHYVYINCEVTDTAYGVIYSIVDQFTVGKEEKVPFTGWSLEKLYSELLIEIERRKRTFVIILDEIDNIVLRKGDILIYYLARINEHLKNSRVSLIGVSNNLKFLELLKPKTKSSLGGESMVFHPYSRKQLEDILNERAKGIFEENALESSVIPLCAAYASRNDGDARVAIDLLRISADIAERNGDSSISEAHVKSARNSMEMDIINEAVKSLTIQSKIVLRSIIKNHEDGIEVMITGDVYSSYEEIAVILGITPLSQRRITDLISELDAMGLINASIKSFGRAGRTKEIKLEISKDIIEKFKKDPFFNSLNEYKTSTQAKLI